MFRNSVPVGIWSAMQNADRSAVVIPSKPQFSMAKTKEKLAEFFTQNESVRQLCDENKKDYPRMHQSVQNTAWQLLMYYIKNWGKSNAKNYEIRITYGYLRRALNDSCCIATLKNHINKLLRMYKGFITEKTRGGLGLPNQNIACIILSVDPKVLQFADERHNEAVRVGELSAEQSRAQQAENAQKQHIGLQSILNAKSAADADAEARRKTPASFGQIFQAAFGDFQKRE